MWHVEHSLEGDVEAEAVWRLWSEPSTWPEWNAGIERIELLGPFATGSTVKMTPTGADPVSLRLADVVEPHWFVDEAELAGVVVRTVHRIEPVRPGRSRISYRTEITGDAADRIGPRLGPAITDDFPDVLAALMARARA